MPKPNSFDASQRGLDRDLIRREQRSTGPQVRDLDEFDSPASRAAYVKQVQADRRRQEIREMRRRGLVSKPTARRQEVSESDMSRLQRWASR